MDLAAFDHGAERLGGPDTVTMVSWFRPPDPPGRRER